MFGFTTPLSYTTPLINATKTLLKFSKHRGVFQRSYGYINIGMVFGTLVRPHPQQMITHSLSKLCSPNFMATVLINPPMESILINYYLLIFLLKCEWENSSYKFFLLRYKLTSILSASCGFQPPEPSSYPSAVWSPMVQ